ncbi:MAG: hypothetical protein UH641_02720 [Bacteroidales bacterium]|nr:hypothetical protein [Bacteroidales bacterium]
MHRVNFGFVVYEQSTDKTEKARWKLAYISALDGLDVLCDSGT